MIDRIHREHGWKATVFKGVRGLSQSFHGHFDLFLGPVFAQGFGGHHAYVGRIVLRGFFNSRPCL